MGLVKDKLIDLIKKQLAEHGTVVWYDAERQYEHLASQIKSSHVGDAKIYHYHPDTGFFSLREEIEKIWCSLDLDKAPKALIYVPLEQSASHYALIEYEVGGCVMQPAQTPPELNSALSAVARLALQPVFPAARLEEIINDVDAGKLSLDEIDRIAERGVEAQTGTLSIIFGTGNIPEVVLRFLTDTSIDKKIAEKHAEKDIAKIISETLGVDFTSYLDANTLRTQASRLILATDFIETLGAIVPESLKTIQLASQTTARRACLEFAQQWRNRRDLIPSYVKAAQEVQAALRVEVLDINLDLLSQTDTFRANEERLQILIEESLLKRPSHGLLELIQKRISGFWSSQTPEIKTRWEVILNAGRVIVEAARIESGLKGKQWSASKLFAEYVYGDNAWCQLDTAQRHLERDVLRYDLKVEQNDSLQRLLAYASQHYTMIVNRLAEQFTQTYRAEGFRLRDVQLQTDIFHDVVNPHLRSKKRVAYILVDAFRYEMGREFLSLIQVSEPTWATNIVPAIATPPTITDIGMAALMPGAQDGIELKAENDNLVPYINGKPLRNSKGRFERLKQFVGNDIMQVTLDEIAPLTKKKLLQDLSKAPFVLVSASDDIDGLGENSPPKARRYMDDIFSSLRRGLSALFNAGFQEVVITADHGFILAERLDDSQKIDAPEGQTVLLKRRVWVGRGGATHDAIMRFSLSEFGIGGNLELATPLGLAVFKVQGGNTEYFHGGLALQELVIPVLSVQSLAQPASSLAPSIQWKLKMGSHKITSPYVSVTVEGKSSDIFGIEAPIIRIEIREQQRVISVPISAMYGFQDSTKDVKLNLGASPQEIETNTITALISDKPTGQTVEIHLLDANTGMSLHRLNNIEINLSLFD